MSAHLPTRRAALLASASGLVAVATACDVGARSPAEVVPTPPPTTPPTPDPTTVGPVPAAGPDEALVDLVLADLGAVLGLVTAARRKTPRLRRDLRPLLVLHQAHARALGGPPGDPGSARLPGSPGAVLDDVRAREERSRRRLVEWAVQAESGQLARLLASMSAGLAQHLVALPREPR